MKTITLKIAMNCSSEPQMPLKTSQLTIDSRSMKIMQWRCECESYKDDIPMPLKLHIPPNPCETFRHELPPHAHENAFVISGIMMNAIHQPITEDELTIFRRYLQNISNPQTQTSSLAGVITGYASADLLRHVRSNEMRRIILQHFQSRSRIPEKTRRCSAECRFRWDDPIDETLFVDWYNYFLGDKSTEVQYVAACQWANAFTPNSVAAYPDQYHRIRQLFEMTLPLIRSFFEKKHVSIVKKYLLFHEFVKNNPTQNSHKNPFYEIYTYPVTKAFAESMLQSIPYYQLATYVYRDIIRQLLLKWLGVETIKELAKTHNHHWLIAE